MKKVYCHFSFRRPRDKDYGLFAAALYADKQGKKLVAHKTRAFKLWVDHQYITAAQAYEHALRCVWEWQGKLKEKGVTNVLLVTDNSILAGWVTRPRGNRNFGEWVEKAQMPYTVGGPRELALPIGLCEPRKYEKSHKYCRHELVVNDIPGTVGESGDSEGAGKGEGRKEVYQIDIDKHTNILDINEEDMPEGMGDVVEIGVEGYGD